MLRKDLQVTDPQKLEGILRSAVYCRLGLVDGGLAYIVPMNFGIAWEDRKLCLYFHSAPEGRKIALIEAAGRASFEADANYKLNETEKACSFSCTYQSVIGHGTVRILRDEQDKLHALRCLMEHNTGKPDWDFSSKSISRIVCIRLEIEEMTGRAYPPPEK
jgi:uncharacterized protein